MTENVDTYVTTTEADQIISETYPPASPLSVSWVVLTETEKERFLAVALERMENLAYKGDRAYYFQSLQFPRIARGIPANFHDAPIEVKRAQAVWASEIVREELYVKRRNADACLALGISTKDNSGELPVGSVPPPPARVKELLHRWLTSWRRI